MLTPLLSRSWTSCPDLYVVGWQLLYFHSRSNSHLFLCPAKIGWLHPLDGKRWKRSLSHPSPAHQHPGTYTHIHDTRTRTYLSISTSPQVSRNHSALSAGLRAKLSSQNSLNCNADVQASRHLVNTRVDTSSRTCTCPRNTRHSTHTCTHAQQTLSSV